jgi:hypothetical protein
LRQIQNAARGEDPIEWAADGAAEGGLGWFRLYADYCYDNPEQVDPEALFDQDLKLGRIANSLTVYCDPAARLPTKADAAYMFVTEDMSKAEFAQKWGRDKLTTLDEFRSTGDQDNWIGDDIVRIAEYWTCDYDTIKAYSSPDGQVLVGVAKPAEYDKATWKERTIYQPRVRCRKITCCHVLDEWEWPGSRIPLFPVLGEELNVDGKTIMRGVVSAAMDPQRMVNYLYSGAVEQVALSNKAPFIVAAGQVENYKAFWQNANTTNFAYLPYDPISSAGTAMPPPQRNVAEPPIQAMVEMLSKSEEAIKATTSIYDPSLGNTNPREKSGRAIMALQQQAEHANSNYVDNVQRAMVDCGDEMVRLCPIFYDRPGRVLKIAGIDDQPEQIALGPTPVQQGDMGMAQQLGANQPPPNAPDPHQQQLAEGIKGYFDLAKGNYTVTVDVTRSHTTKRLEQLDMLGGLLEKNPQLLQLFGDIYFRAMDVEGSQALAERAEKMLPQQLRQGQDGQPNVQQMQAQMAQAGQMVEMLSKELQAKTEIIQTDAVKAQASLQEKQLEQDTRIKIAWIQASAQLATAGMKVDAENARSFVDALEQKGAAALDAHMEKLALAHDAAKQAADHDHERQMMQSQAAVQLTQQAGDQEHEATQAEADRQASAQQSEADRQAAAEQAAQKGVE